MTETTNLHLKKYESTDSVNLMTGYNASMDIIDQTIGNGLFQPDPSNDADFDVSKLAGAKVTSTGIIYFIAQTNGGN